MGIYITTLLENRYKDFWRNLLQNQQGKLVTYKYLKEDFVYENYLDCVKLSAHQKALTKLRISNHKLHIETGRYKRPITPRQERICELCGDGVEDESHFLLTCKQYDILRLNYFGINTFEGDFLPILTSLLSNFTIFKPPVVAAFIYEAMRQRQLLLAG